MLRLLREAWLAMVAHALDGLPDEACGLLVGTQTGGGATGDVERFEPAANAARSAKLYTIDPKDHLRIERRADDDDLEVLGVMHSHTHTDAVPSPTDLAQAPDPAWHYVIVSLRGTAPVLRSWRIVDGEASEEPVEVVEVVAGS